MAPIIFNLCLLIVWAMFMRGRAVLLAEHSPLSGQGWLLLGVVLPALLGFVLGAERSITLLGHFFYTNRGYQQNLVITIAAWVALFSAAYWLSA